MNKRKLTHVRWDITVKCNLDCVHCYAANLYPTKTDLKLENVLQIIDHLQDPGVETIAFYGGEPLTRVDLTEIIRYCSNKEIQTMIVTNGILLDQYIERLVDAGLSGVAVSLDGATKETYQKIRRNPYFDDIITSFKRLKDIGVRYRAINTVIMRENVSETEQLIDLAIECSATSLNFDGLGIEGNAIESSLCSALSPEEVIHFTCRVIEKLIEGKLPIDFVSLPFTPPILLNYLNQLYQISLPIRPIFHMATINGLFVDAVGNAYACKGTHPGFTMKGTKFHTNGISLIKNTLLDVLQSPEFEELYYRMNLSDKECKLTPCKECQYFLLECSPCPITAQQPDKHYAENCLNFPISKICELLNPSNLSK